MNIRIIRFGHETLVTNSTVADFSNFPDLPNCFPEKTLVFSSKVSIAGCF